MSGKNQYRKILDVNDTYAGPNIEKEAILNAFRKLGMLTHPDYNKVKKSADAFKSKPASFFASAIIFLTDYKLYSRSPCCG